MTVLTAGQAADSPLFQPLLEGLSVIRVTGQVRTRPDAVRGDKAYSSKAIRAHLRSRRITAVIPQRENEKANRRRKGSRGGRPPTFDAQTYRGRNVIERNYSHLKQWRGLATRYDKLAQTYLAAVHLRAILAWTAHLSDTP